LLRSRRFHLATIVLRDANWHQRKHPVWCFPEKPESLMIAAVPHFASTRMLRHPESNSKTTGVEAGGAEPTLI
jgi:hypothetical protein